MRKDATIISISNTSTANTITTTTSTTTTISTYNLTTHNNQSISNNRSNISMALPPECLVQTHPVVLISNVYNPMDSQCQLDPNFFMDLEAGNYIAFISLLIMRILHFGQGIEYGCVYFFHYYSYHSIFILLTHGFESR